jgi:hypothetical protein
MFIIKLFLKTEKQEENIKVTLDLATKKLPVVPFQPFNFWT